MANSSKFILSCGPLNIMARKVGKENEKVLRSRKGKEFGIDSPYTLCSAELWGALMTKGL